MTDKSDGEVRRDRIVEILGENYGKGLVDRATLVAMLPGWGNAHLDNALHVLKKRNVVFKALAGGYELTTAPAGYNERLVAERNAGGAVKVSALDEKPIDAEQAAKPDTKPAPADRIDADGWPKAYPVLAPEAPLVVWTCQGPGCGVVVDQSGQLCTVHQPQPTAKADPCDGCKGQALVNGQCGGDCSAYDEAPAGLDPIAVRNALAALSVRVTRSVDDKELKLEVLDYLGRILDDSIEAVLVSITEDLKR
jgi:hypothetical protein